MTFSSIDLHLLSSKQSVFSIALKTFCRYYLRCKSILDVGTNTKLVTKRSQGYIGYSCALIG